MRAVLDGYADQAVSFRFVLDARYVHPSNGRYYSTDSIRSAVASSELYSLG